MGRVEKHPESEGEAQVSTPHCLVSDPDLATPTQQCPIPRAENHFHKEPPCLKGVGLIFLPVSVVLVGLSARRQSCDHVGQSQLSLRDVTPGGRDECLWSWVIPRAVPRTPAAWIAGTALVSVLPKACKLPRLYLVPQPFPTAGKTPRLSFLHHVCHEGASPGLCDSPE